MNCENGDRIRNASVCMSCPVLVVFFLALGSDSGLAWPQAKVCTDPILKHAWANYDASNLGGAESDANKLAKAEGACGTEARELLSLISANRRMSGLSRKVEEAIKKQDKTKTCEDLFKMESEIGSQPMLKRLLPQLTKLKDRIGGCKPQFSDEDQRKLEQARKCRQQKQYTCAQDNLAALRERYPDHEEVRAEWAELQRDKQRDQEETRKKYDKVCDDAEQYLNQMEFAKAMEFVKRAEDSSPREQRAGMLKKKIEQARDADFAGLLEGVNHFYAGDYAQAQAKLESYSHGKHSKVVAALARFYTAAALAGDYFLSGASDESKRHAAMNAFAQLQKDFEGLVTYPWSTISPKIKTIYDAAAKGPQPALP